MFTGIIEHVGTIQTVSPGAGGGRVLTIRHAFEPSSIQLGDSIATSGVCLTVTKLEGDRFTVDVGPETLLRTSLGGLTSGARVNLERSVTLGTRLGGHLVQGHVDAVGKIARIARRENAYDLDIETPPSLLRMAVPQGSIAIDGISLTITGRTSSAFSVMIIPHTWQVTTLGERKIGDPVNLEADLIIRYVAGLLEGSAKSAGGPTLAELLAKEFGS